MAIASRVQAVTAVQGVASALPVTLADGDVIEARVAAILPNGQVRLSTSLGTTDVSTSVPLSPGATVKLLVQTVGAQLTLALIETTGSSGGSSASPSAAKAYGSAFSSAQQALAEVLQSALPNQAGPAALFANLKPIVERGGRTLPPDVTVAARDVLAHALDGEKPVQAEDVKKAVIGSGVFRETRLASGDAGAALPARDLKSALIALRTALAAVVASLPADPPDVATPPTVQGTGATRAAEAGGPSALVDAATGSAANARGATASSPPGAGTTATGLPDALIEALARLPAAGREAAVQAIRAALDPHDPELARVLAQAGLTQASPPSAEDDAPRATPPATAPDEETGRRPLPASIPRIDLPPRTEDPAGPSLRNGMSQGEAARLLLGQTDATLDRVRLSQYGALHRDDGPLPTSARDAPAWIFDVPVLQGREATSAQVRITGDGRGHGADAAGRRWSVEFALDTTATGPIHAEIRLWGRHVGVTLWAERADTVLLLKNQAAVLHDALGQAELEVEDVAVLAGSPQPPPAERGYFVDTRS